MAAPRRFIKAEKNSAPASAPSGYPASPGTENPYDKPKNTTVSEDSTTLPDTSPPPETTTTTTTSSNPAPPDAYAAGSVGYAAVTGAGSNASGAISKIKRPGTTYQKVYGAAADTRLQVPNGYQREVQNRATVDEYLAEYYEKVTADQEQRKWWAQRAIAFGLAKYDPTSPSLLPESEFLPGGAVARLFAEAGEVTLMNPVLNQLTPEEWVDSRFNALGGQAALDAAMTQANPITTYTNVSTTTMNKTQADAIADEVAMQVLGRMATKSEMARARRAMNKVMAANPTVSTQTTDSTDPNNVKSTQRTEAGVSAADAAAAYEQKLRRSSEGTAFTVGKGFEQALAMLDRGL